VSGALRPVRRHRDSPDWPRRLGLRAGATALVIAALAIGTVITSDTPDVDAQQRPFIRTGEVSAPVNARTFEATVLAVRGAAVITDLGLTHDTTGVWVVVRVRLIAIGAPVSIGYAALSDGRDRSYRATGRFGQPLLGRLLEPGLPVTGELAFEVPASVATSLSIQLAVASLDRRMDTVAQVRLPITAGQVREWRAFRTPISVERPKGTP
jgi:hypothetical protein